MALVTSQQLEDYYNEYREREISFNKQVVQVLRLLPREVYLKCHGDQMPCVIYSASMVNAKIVANLRANSLQKIRLANNTVALRFAFERQEKPEPLFFFVPAKVTNYTFYNSDIPDFYFLTLEYTTKPPDDLIDMLGQLLEANINSKRRKEERIDINPASIKALGLESKEASIVIDKTAKKCIIRDLSFSGAKILLFGASESDVEKTVVLNPVFSAVKAKILLPGEIIRFEEVVGRSDIGAFGIKFAEGKTPMDYTVLVNGYLRQHRQTGR